MDMLDACSGGESDGCCCAAPTPPPLPPAPVVEVGAIAAAAGVCIDTDEILAGVVRLNILVRVAATAAAAGVVVEDVVVVVLLWGVWSVPPPLAVARKACVPIIRGTVDRLLGMKCDFSTTGMGGTGRCEQMHDENSLTNNERNDGARWGSIGKSDHPSHEIYNGCSKHR